MGKYPLTKKAGDKLFMPGFFDEETFLKAMDYKAKPGQVYISTFPKCGTTWTQHIVLLIYNRGEPFDPHFFFKRSPFIEMAGTEAVDAMEEPGVIKTHFPFHLTPYHPEAKYIYVARNPKDTSVSLFHHNRNFPGYEYADGKFEDFFDLFYKGETEWGDYTDHVLGWYKHKDDENVLFLTFESMKKDHAGSVKKIAHFLSEEYGRMVEENPDILAKIVECSSVSYMKKHNDSSFSDMFSLPPDILLKDPKLSNGLRAALAGLAHDQSKGKREFNFVRKGIVGDWKTLYTEEQSRLIDEKFNEKSKGTNLMEIFQDSGCFRF